VAGSRRWRGSSPPNLVAGRLCDYVNDFLKSVLMRTKRRFI
jgi:hypothetical protein